MWNLKILTSTLFILFTINSTLCFCFKGSNTNTTEDNFKNLRFCLTSNGVKEKNIIKRNTGRTYTELNWQWNSNGYMAPMAYLVAEKPSDVQIAIKCCSLLKIRTVPRSGGHSFTKDSYGDFRSLVIDLANLNQISVDPNTMICEIGSGSRSGYVYYNLWEKGKFMIPLGKCPFVGISGLTLGGGHGFFTRYVGLTADNLLELEMVDSKGNILVINNSTNEYLYWALRGGGGGSFGIVTKFKFRMYSAPEYISFAVYYYNLKDFPQFFDAWQSLITSNLPNRLGTHFEIKNGVITMQINNVKWRKNSKVDLEQIIGSFSFPRAIKSSNNVLTYPDFLLMPSNPYYNNSLKDLLHISVLKKFDVVAYVNSYSFYVDKIASKDEISKLHVLLEDNMKFINRDGYSVMFVQQYGGAINKISRSETAFVHRDKTLYNVLLEVYSTTERNLKVLTVGIKNVYEKSKEYLNHTESYQNYLSGDQTSLKRYYGANLKRLTQVKMRVDPENIFCSPHSIPANMNYKKKLEFA